MKNLATALSHNLTLVIRSIKDFNFSELEIIITMSVINTVAQFERDLLIECTQSCLAKAKQQGKTLGRAKVSSNQQIIQVIDHLKEGKTIAAIARSFDVTRQIIMRIRNKMD